MNVVHKTWLRLSRLPMGSRLFDLGIRLYIPYTGSMRARMKELRPGFAKVILKDRRRVRNHLGSVHAIALANVVEYTGNLALACGLPENARFIVKSISVEYLKKARGTLTGECQAPAIHNNDEKEFQLEVTIRDVMNNEVARGALVTLVGPIR